MKRLEIDCKIIKTDDYYEEWGDSDTITIEFRDDDVVFDFCDGDSYPFKISKEHFRAISVLL